MPHVTAQRGQLDIWVETLQALERNKSLNQVTKVVLGQIIHGLRDARFGK